MYGVWDGQKEKMHSLYATTRMKFMVSFILKVLLTQHIYIAQSISSIFLSQTSLLCTVYTALFIRLFFIHWNLIHVTSQNEIK